MRVPTPPFRIKAGAPAILCLLLSGCAAAIAQAPFPERPDTVQPGSLRGPFDGQVLEQANGNPIPAALLIGSWTYERPGPLPFPTRTLTRSVLTRSDGGYELPAAPPPASGTVLGRFTLLVYKAGFVGYRSDHRYDDGGLRRDFAQRRQRIRLDRFPAGESHARHLVFLGGDGALRRVAQAEIVQAALELTEAQPPRRPAPEPEVQREPPPLPQAKALLLVEDLQALAKGLRLSDEPLADNVTGEHVGARYDGVHYRAQGKPESFDAALRVYRPSRLGQPEEEALAALFAQLKESLPGAQDLTGLGDQALRAFDNKRRVHGVVAILKGPGLLLQLACGASLCSKEGAAQKLLTRAIERLEPTK